MRTFGLVLDSTTHINELDDQFKDASIVSLSFMLDDHEVENHELTHIDIQNSKKKYIDVITPKPEAFIKAYNEQKSLGYKDIFIMISSTYFSDSFNQAILAKTILEKDDFHIIDTKSYASGINHILYQINTPSNYEQSAKTILNQIQNLIKNTQTLLITRNLPTNKLLNLLPLNYIVEIKDDLKLIKTFGKQDQVFEFLKKRIQNEKRLGYDPYLLIMYNDLKEAKILQQELFTHLNINIYIDDLLPNLIYTKFKKPIMGLTIGRKKD